jgi:hypothetical protein
MSGFSTHTYESFIVSPSGGEHEGKFFAFLQTAHNRENKPDGPFDTFDEARQKIVDGLNVKLEIFRQHIDGRI